MQPIPPLHDTAESVSTTPRAPKRLIGILARFIGMCQRMIRRTMAKPKAKDRDTNTHNNTQSAGQSMHERLNGTEYPAELLAPAARGDSVQMEWKERCKECRGVIHSRADGQWWRIVDESAQDRETAWVESQSPHNLEDVR